jgi:type VI secretion system secreted protein VgrG
MREDLHLPTTLAITDCQATLRVISFSGRDALNEPFLFEIDVFSADRQLEVASLLQCDAYLAFTDSGAGVHGQVGQVQRLHRAASVDLYRITLVPALEAMAAPRAPRSFNGMTAVQIILQLLHEHGLRGDAVHFQRVTGVYAVREHCVQYQESDLHLLQRLCEEEGIHFRFEHHPQRHVLIFSDDPADFPEILTAVTVRPQGSGPGAVEGLDHLAECLSLGTSYSSHEGSGPGQLAPAWMFGDTTEDELADNEVLSEVSITGSRDGVTSPTPPRSQTGVRRLERLRCERRQIIGLGNLPQLHSGQVMRVIGHHASPFNDQWLLTEVHHSGKQLQLLQNHADAAAIVRALARPRSVALDGLSAGYRNALRVIPWAMPFRAALSHPRPRIDTVQTAQLVSAVPDEQGRLRIRYDWQTTDIEQSGTDSWAKVARSVSPTDSPCRLQVRFLDGNADQPYICGVEPQPPKPVTATEPISNAEAFLLRSRNALSLRSAVAQLEIDAGRIRVSHRTDLPAETTVRSAAVSGV